MPEIPAENFSPLWSDDNRHEVPPTGDERAVLTGFLDWHRATFEAKCRGVPPERLSDKGVPPSDLSLHGLVRHLAAVERWWFRIQLAGEDVPMLFYSDDDPDQDFEWLDGDVGEALEIWREECERSRERRRPAIPGRHRHEDPRRIAVLSALAARQSHRGVRPPQRSRRPAP